MRHAFTFSVAFLLSVSAALAQPVINGTAEDHWYGGPLTVQDNATDFGDSNLGRPDWANGSELDAAYAVVHDGILYLVLAGNLETNWNKIEIFFDTIPGQGQNPLLGAENPDIDYGALQRMGAVYDPEFLPGLAFATGFLPDYYVTVGAGGNPTAVHVSYAELYVDEFDVGVGYYLGWGPTACGTSDGQLFDGDPGCPFVVRCTLNNRNVAGVLYGMDFDDGSGVATGVELAIPLEAIGNPTSNFTIVAFINSSSHDFVSNQVLGGLGGGWGSLGEPRWVDLSVLPHAPFTVPISPAPLGACCYFSACGVLTQANCEAISAGVYLGDRTSCEGNPCDGIDAGRCCIDDGYSGLCEFVSEDECSYLGGIWTAGEDCQGCPCLLGAPGACCYSDLCVDDVREDDCLAGGGDFVGYYSVCDVDTCLVGACCEAHDCSEVRRFECLAAGGRYQGSDVFCDSMPCAQTIWTPYVAGDMNGWYPDVDAMIESAPGIYEFTYGLLDPYYRYEFKITDGTWDLAIPDANSWCYADESGAVTITYDANEYADGWAPSWDRIGLSVDPGSWTAVGDWQGWDPTNGDTQMSPIGGGIHTHTESGLTGGMHYWKAVVTGTWDAISWNARSVNAADMGFLITSPYDVATFQVDALAGTVRVDVSRDCNNNGTEDGDELAGCDGSPWCSDCNANGILDECDLLYGTSTDVDGNGVPDECELCPCGDVDRSGGPVDLNDFARFALCYGFSSPGGDCTGPDFACSDIDADGTVSLSDFATFAVWYGLVSSQTVPECNIR